MAATDRAYTSEYSTLGQAYQPGQWAALPKNKPSSPKVKRTRPKPQLETRSSTEQKAAYFITHKMLVRSILLLAFAGAVLISTIWMSAKATEIKYEINKINRENVVLQNEISMLNIKIESANSIELIEDYATSELKMQYPKSQQCIYIASDETASEDLADRIREKAYKE